LRGNLTANGQLQSEYRKGRKINYIQTKYKNKEIYINKNDDTNDDNNNNNSNKNNNSTSINTDQNCHLEMKNEVNKSLMTTIRILVFGGIRACILLIVIFCILVILTAFMFT
jgi:hypothetical protein